MSITETIINFPSEYGTNVFGEYDRYLKKIERALQVTIVARDSDMKLIGTEIAIKRASNVF